MASDGQEAIGLVSSGSSPDAVVMEMRCRRSTDARCSSGYAASGRKPAARTVFVTSDATRERYRAFSRYSERHFDQAGERE